MSAYSDLILGESALVSAWSGAGASGDLPDLKGSNAAVPKGTITRGVASIVPGAGTLCCDFQNTGNLLVADANSLDLNGMTLEGWFKWDALPGSGKYTFFFYKGDAYVFYLDNATVPGTPALHGAAYQSDGGDAVVLDSNFTPTVGTLYHIVYTFNTSDKKIRFYRNGSLVATSSAMAGSTPVHTNATGLSLGGFGDGNANYCIDGKVAWLAVYNAPLTLTAIGNHYTAGITPPTQTIAVGQTTETDTAQPAYVRPLQPVPETELAQAITAFQPTNMRRVLRGEAEHTSLRITGNTPGEAGKLFQSATLKASAVADSDGVITFTAFGTPLTGAHVQVYTDNTYATPIPHTRWPDSGEIDVAYGNVLERRPMRLGARGVRVIDDNASMYYPTSQFGSSDAVCASPTKIFFAYRVGGPGNVFAGESVNGDLVVVRIDRYTGQVDQGPFTLKTGITDGHEYFSVQRAPSGKLRAVYGGANSAPLYIRESTNVGDITAWGTALNISLGSVGSFLHCSYKIGADGKNYFMANNYWANSTHVPALRLGTSPDNDIGTVTWNTLMANFDPSIFLKWTAISGDMALDETTSPATQHIVFSCLKRYDETGTTADYRNAYYLKSQDGGATAKKADGSSITLPLAMGDATNGTCGADLVSGGNHYGPACHIAADNNGDAIVLHDVDYASDYRDFDASHWTGSAWAANQVYRADTPDGGLFGSTLMNHDGRMVFVACPSLSHGGVGASRVIRKVSSDKFATGTDSVVFNDDYPQYFYDQGKGSGGTAVRTALLPFEYPKSPRESPGVIIFSAVTFTQSTVLMTVVPLALPVAQAEETDTAQTVKPVKYVHVAQVAEADTALGLTKFVRAALVAETDTAQAIRPVRLIVAGQASETDSALGPVRPARLVVLSQPAETDTAQPIHAFKRRTLGQAFEEELAQHLGNFKLAMVGQAAETDNALAATWSPKHRAVRQASESDQAQEILAAFGLGVAGETDAAQPIRPARVYAVAQAVELEAALAAFPAKRRAVGIGAETDAALAVIILRPHTRAPYGGRIVGTEYGGRVLQSR
jgi:hypothetical protein